MSTVQRSWWRRQARDGKMCAILAVASLAFVNMPTSSAAVYPTFGGGPTLANPIVPGHDYGASLVADLSYGVDRYLWCSTDGTADKIWYSDTNGAWNFAFGASTSGWDTEHVCDPSMVIGDFVYGGNHYRYAIYYTANRDHSGLGTDNAIGVMFTNDLTNSASYVRLPAPVILPDTSLAHPTPLYGAGQQSAMVIPGTMDDVRVTYRDNSSGTIKFYTITSTDGYTFSPSSRQAVTTDGLVSKGIPYVPINADFGLDVADGYYYGVVSPVTVNDEWLYVRPDWDGAGPGRSDMYAYEIIGIPRADFESGTGTWTILGQVNSDHTQGGLTFAPGLLRDHFGHLDSWAPGLLISASVTPNVYDTDVQHGDVRTIYWSQARTEIRRYFNGWDHYTTSAASTPPGGYWLEGTQYYLNQVDNWPAGYLAPLYSCVVPSFTPDFFMSRFANCENAAFYQIGIAGYIWTSNVPGTTALYRCWSGSQNFTSLASNCEGYTKVADLGFVALNQ
jgi:hypothetical protein